MTVGLMDKKITVYRKKGEHRLCGVYNTYRVDIPISYELSIDLRDFVQYGKYKDRFELVDETDN